MPSKKAILHILGSLSTMSLNFIVMILVVRIGGMASAGDYALINVLFVPILVVCSFSSKNNISTDHCLVIDEYSKKFLLGSLLFFFFSFLLMAFYPYDDESLGSVLLVYVAFVKFIDLISEYKFGFWIEEDCPEKIGMSKIFRFLVSGFFVFLMYILDVQSLVIYFLAIAISITFVVCFYDKSLVFLWDSIFFFRKLKNSLSGFESWGFLTLATLIIYFLGIAPRATLKFFFSASDVGELAIIAFYVSVGGQVINSFVAVNIRYLSKLDHDDFFCKSKSFVFNVFLYSIVVFVFIVFISGPVNEIIYGVNYDADLFQVVLIGGVAVFQYLASTYNAFYVAKRKFEELFKCYAFSFFCILCFYCFCFFQGSLFFVYLAYMASYLIVFLVLCYFFYYKEFFK